MTLGSRAGLSEEINAGTGRLLGLVGLTPRRLGIIVLLLAAVYRPSQAAQGREEEHTNSSKLETGEHAGAGCLLGGGYCEHLSTCERGARGENRGRLQRWNWSKGGKDS